MIVHQKKIFLILTAIVGIWVLWPFQDFQFLLSQGDHGRELYAYKKTMEGALAYRDFSWLFGPLMPYYFSAFFRLFGVDIQSVLLGQNLLIWASGILIYMICAVRMSPLIAFAGALWYWAFRGAEFFYSYHHSGGLFFILLPVYFLFRYIDSPRFFHVMAGFASIFLLTLIRLNMGVAVLIGFAFSLCLTDCLKKETLLRKKIKLYGFLSLYVIAGTSFIYWLLLHPLPSYVIEQSFPYSGSHRVDAHLYVKSVWSVLYQIIFMSITASWPRVVLFVIFLLCILQSGIKLVRRQVAHKELIDTLLIFVSLCFLILLILHEFLASAVHFRLIWARPLVIILCFFILDRGLRDFRRILQISITMVIIFLSCESILHQNLTIDFHKKSNNRLHIGNNNVYVSQAPGWLTTVHGTTALIKEQVPEGSKLFALPHDSIYYFLSERDSGTRQLDFFDHTRISPEQENDIIAELEKNKVNYVILSNRAFKNAEGLGIFGQTYCPILFNYIDKNFHIVKAFGEGRNVAGWVDFHETLVVKRKKPLD